ncbi:MAG: hypothetical protein KTR32_43195 [Granulosicoccus sp.]|nr:hypothetical protein [Granulosicoccus sp.]
MAQMIQIKPIGYLLILLAVVGAWMLGQRQGKALMVRGLYLSPDSASSAAAPDGAIAVRGQLAQTQHALSLANKENEALRAVTRDLQIALAEGQSLYDKDSAELNLYRRIGASEEAPRSLGIDSVVLSDSDPRELTFRLIQWRGRHSVHGEIDVSLGEIDSSDAQTRGQSSLQQKLTPLTTVDFRFRFFQELTIPIDQELQSVPDFLEIRVQPDGWRHEPVIERLEWSELLQNS